MEKFSINIFLSKIGRLSAEQVKDLVEQNVDNLDKISLVDANQIMNCVEQKFMIVSNWYQGESMVDILTFKAIAERTPKLSKYTFEEIDNMNNLHPVIQVELAYILKENEKINLLNNFGSKLKPFVIQNFILGLSKNNQIIMINKFKDKIIDCEADVLFTFMGALNANVQKRFIEIEKEYLNKQDNESISLLVTAIDESNLKLFFEILKEKIKSYNKEEFTTFLSMLSGESLKICNDMFKEHIKDISSVPLIYKFGMYLDDPKELYNIWKENPEKIEELPMSYFTLIIRRLDDESRKQSLIDFKNIYNKMAVDELLDLFGFDTDEIKLTLLTEYKDKISKIKTFTLVTYIDNNFDDKEIEQKLYLLYKDYIVKLDDKDFIKFINKYSEKRLKLEMK